MKGANTTNNKIFFNNTYSPVSLYTYHAAKTLHCKITIREKIAVKAQRGCGCFEDNIANRKHENGKRKRKDGNGGKEKKKAKEHRSFADYSTLFGKLCGAQYQRMLKKWLKR